MTRNDLQHAMRTSEREEWLLCRYCIEAMRSRGESIHIGDLVIDGEYAESSGDFRCEWCGEYDDLYECF